MSHVISGVCEAMGAWAMGGALRPTGREMTIGYFPWSVLSGYKHFVHGISRGKLENSRITHLRTMSSPLCSLFHRLDQG